MFSEASRTNKTIKQTKLNHKRCGYWIASMIINNPGKTKTTTKDVRNKSKEKNDHDNHNVDDDKVPMSYFLVASMVQFQW